MPNENIKLEFAHICESVIEAKNGNLSIINIFNQINSVDFPAAHPGIIVIIGVGRENEGIGAKEYPISVKIIYKEDEKTIAELSNKMILIPELPGQIRFSARFSPVVFHKEGFYEVIVSINNDVRKILNLEVRKLDKK